MLEYLNTIIVGTTIFVIGAILIYALGAKSQFIVKLLQKQQINDGSMILTFLLPKNIKKIQLKVGQQILIKINKSGKGKQFTPIQSNIGSFKILIIPSMQHQNEDKILQQLKKLNKNDQVFIKFAKNNFQYLGGTGIKVIDSNKQVLVKYYKNLYILAQGNKIPIAYQIVKGICEDKALARPDVTILFVGSNIKDFAMKNEFQQLQEKYDNVFYFYSMPVKGQRQPSIAGMGISSEKVSQSFSTEVQKTFCVLCAQQNDLCVTVERALLNKKVPPSQIYKY